MWSMWWQLRMLRVSGAAWCSSVMGNVVVRERITQRYLMMITFPSKVDHVTLILRLPPYSSSPSFATQLVYHFERPT